MNKNLLKREFDEAAALIRQAKNEGYSIKQTAVLLYKCGLIDGKRSQQEKVKAICKKYYALKNRTFDDMLEETEAEMTATIESLPQTENSGERLENGQSDATNE